MTTIDIGSIDNAVELVFSGTDEHRRYILLAEPRPHLDTLNKYPRQQVKTTTHYYIDDTDGQWFACYNVDCFDPPFAIVRARSFTDAYEVFCDEFSDWLKVEKSDAKDYPEDERQYNANGVHIDTDNVQIHPLALLIVNVNPIQQS